jgi:hypothetical protein
MAYPGVEYMNASHSAATWAEELDKPMHGIRIETNAYVIELVCHDLVVTRMATGDPVTGELRPVD